MTRAVVGAHTLGYNSYAFGAAVLGTYNAKSVAGQTIGNFAVCGLFIPAVGRGPTRRDR
jgi:hypothetical protein